MSWKDSIKPITSEESTGSWKDTIQDNTGEEAEMSPDTPGMGEAVLRGIGQGATLGFADEAAAGIQAGLDVATSDKELKDLMNLYRTYKQLQQEREGEVEKAYPKTYLGSNLAGGIATLPLTSSLQSAKAALTTSGIAGLGMSKADLTTLNPNQYKQAAKDVGISTAIGGGLYGTGKAIGTGLDFLKSLKLAKGAKEGFEMGRKGFDLTRPEATTEIFKELTNMSREVGGELGKQLENAAIKVNKSIENAAKNGTKVDIDDVVKFIDDELSKVATDLPEWQKAKDQFANLIKDRIEGKLTQTQKIIPQFEEKVLPAKPGAEQVLKNEAELEIAKLQAQGINATYSIVPSIDSQGRKILTRVINQIDNNGSQLPNQKVSVFHHSREAEQDLAEQAAREIEKYKHLGQKADYQIIPGEDSEGRKILKKVISVQDEQPSGGSVKAKSVYDYPEQPQQLLKEEIEPIVENVATRQGGIGTNPEVDKAVNLRRAIGTLGEQETYGPVKTVAQRATGKLSEVINQSDAEIKASNELINKIRDALEYTGISGRSADELADSNKVRSLISSLADESRGGDKARVTFNDAIDAIAEFNPEYAQKIRQEAYDLAKKYKVAGDISQENQVFYSPLRTLESLSSRVGNIAGQKVGNFEKNIPSSLLNTLKLSNNVTRMGTKAITDSTLPRASAIVGVDQKVNTPERMSRNIYDSSDEELGDVISTLNDNPKYANYGMALNDAITNKQSDKKNAVLFTIMQNPEMRKLLYPSEGEEVK